MAGDRLDLLRGQFDLTWSPAESHLPHVTTAMLLWEPASPCWTVHQDADGRRRPDSQSPEPDPIPPPTGAWITWHLGSWWTTALRHLTGRPTELGRLALLHAARFT